ncbi:conserved hypothetical protein [Bacillus sp. IT-79MI2]|uniref:Uncharacterized protein n=1 Tax=Bacillus pseudomycoides TaxID=64104 RepID=A0A1Y3MGU1_9BACI|nr:hypothetical protein BW425_09485 [Bacillus pseudomycoides]PEK62523.1 hypothetical protein CN590_21515 [Bacillus pseudomycoides]PEL25251.1 hypothetical protein CN608_16060 [Bacillus pseudomycoides]PGE88352.1 hypothetical protein COM55_02495 [Bacillus pseudomycoides]
MKSKGENKWRSLFVFIAVTDVWKNRNGFMYIQMEKPFFLEGKEDPSMDRSGRILFRSHAK